MKQLLDITLHVSPSKKKTLRQSSTWASALQHPFSPPFWTDQNQPETKKCNIRQISDLNCLLYQHQQQEKDAWNYHISQLKTLFSFETRALSRNRMSEFMTPLIICLPLPHRYTVMYYHSTAANSLTYLKRKLPGNSRNYSVKTEMVGLKIASSKSSLRLKEGESENQIMQAYKHYTMFHPPTT